jgi:hypothetical protein
MGLPFFIVYCLLFSVFGFLLKNLGNKASSEKKCRTPAPGCSAQARAPTLHPYFWFGLFLQRSYTELRLIEYFSPNFFWWHRRLACAAQAKACGYKSNI